MSKPKTVKKTAEKAPKTGAKKRVRASAGPASASRVLRLDRITHSKISSLDKTRTVILATMSPLEVHGPHLPLGQDFLEAYAIAEATAHRIAEQRPDWTVVLLPPVPVATDCVPKLGSVSFPVGVVREVAYRLLRPFAAAGFTRLAYSSFHGGPRHFTALESAADRLSKEFPGVAAACLFSAVLGKLVEGDVFHEAVKDVPGCEIDTRQLKQDHHGGFVETSIGLHKWPEWVEDGWEDLPPSVATEEIHEDRNDSFLYGRQGPASLKQKAQQQWDAVASIYRSAKHFMASTYFGYPALASEEAGAALFEHLTNLCVETASEFLDKGTDMPLHSPLWKLQRVLLSPTVNKVADDWLKIYS